MKRILPAKELRQWRGRLITVLFAIMTILFLTLLVLVPALYVQLSHDYNDQVITCAITSILIYITCDTIVWLCLQFAVVFSVKSNHTDMTIYRWDGRKRFSNSVGVMVATDTGMVQSIHQCYMPCKLM